jgi:predicted HTH domain antitoxin
LGEAATLAEVSIYAMMDYVEREKIQPQALTDKEMEEESINAKKLFDNMKK